MVTEILPQVVSDAVTSRTPLEAWSTLFTHKILEVILKNANAEIERYLAAQPNTNKCASL